MRFLESSMARFWNSIRPCFATHLMKVSSNIAKDLAVTCLRFCVKLEHIFYSCRVQHVCLKSWLKMMKSLQPRQSCPVASQLLVRMCLLLLPCVMHIRTTTAMMPLMYAHFVHQLKRTMDEESISVAMITLRWFKSRPDWQDGEFDRTALWTAR